MGAGRALGELAGRLRLSDEETLAIFSLDALGAISGEVGHRPEVEILDALTTEAAERIGQAPLARWLRAGPAGTRPLDLLLGGDFGGFEDALALRLAEAAA